MIILLRITNICIFFFINIIGAAGADVEKYNGLFSALVKIVRKEGWKTLYQIYLNLIKIIYFVKILLNVLIDIMDLA